MSNFNENEDYTVVPEVCFTQSGYKGTRVHSTQYLGFDRKLDELPTITLEAVMNSNEEMESLTDWWDEQSQRGTKLFIVTARLFGRLAEYGIRQISPFEHSVDGGVNKVKFGAEILLDKEIGNHRPTAISADIFVAEDSTFNFVVLHGEDEDKEYLEFDIGVPPANGTLTGTPPNIMYTPKAGYVGDDCFTFFVKDKWSKSIPAVIAIGVGQDEKPSFIQEYTLGVETYTWEEVIDGVVISTEARPKGIRVGGNYWYLLDHDDAKWTRGNGGYVHPHKDGAYKITIASLDHTIDSRDTHRVIQTNIISWGTRTDFTGLCRDMIELTDFSISASAGVCQAENTKWFFLRTPKLTSIPLFDTSKSTTFQGFVNSSGITQFPDFDLTNGEIFEGMFAFTNIQTLPFLYTTKGQIFKNMFLSAGTTCMRGIDTRNALDTIDMFLSSVFMNPSSATQTTIKAGMYWDKQTACSVVPNAIVKTGGSEVCNIADFDGTCVSSGIYEASYVAGTNVGIVTYLWTVSNGTIVGSATGSTVTIDSLAKGSNTNVYIGCTISDDNGSSYTGTYTYNHKRTYTYLSLELPLHSGVLNLTDYIVANGGSGKNVKVTNNRIVPTITSGSLTGILSVEFVNNGEVQAYVRTDGKVSGLWERGAFQVEVAGKLKLTNNGVIRGCGGLGGKGGQGKNNSYTTSHTEIRNGSYGNNAFVWRQCHNLTQIAWGGHLIHVSGNKSGPYTVNGVANLYRGAYQYAHGGPSANCASNASNTDPVYKVERRYTKSNARTGGAGGRGGYGAGYGHSDAYAGSWRTYQAGAVSNPTGGNSGGRGGAGGWWGSNGYDGIGGAGGGGAGQTGGLAGKSISGTSLLLAGSKLGSVSGSTRTTKF